MSRAGHRTCPEWRASAGATVACSGGVVFSDTAEWRIAPENVRSQAVARKLGATIDRRVELAEHGPADVWLHPR